MAAVGIAIWTDRRSRVRDQEQQTLQLQRDREQQLEDVKRLLQTMVVDRIETAFHEIGKLDKRQRSTENAYSELKGFLRGKGWMVPDLCPEDLAGEGK